MYLLIVIIADYTKTAFHAPDSLAGLVVGIFVVGSLIGRFYYRSLCQSFWSQENFNLWITFSSDYSIIIFCSRSVMVLILHA